MLKKLRKITRRFIYIDTDDYDGRFLRIDIYDFRPALAAWFERVRKSDDDRAWDAFQQKVKWWQDAMQRWDRWQVLEARAAIGAALTFEENLDLEMYRAEADIRRDMRRQIWGSGVPKLITGLKSFDNMMRLAQPRMIRDLKYELHKPNVLWNRVRSDQEDATRFAFGIDVVVDPLVPEGQAFLINPDYLKHEPLHDDVDWDWERKYDHRYEEWHDMGGDA